MKTLLLFLSLFLQDAPKRDIFIVLDSGKESAIIAQELEYDYPDNDLGKLMKESKDRVLDRCKIVRRFETEHKELNGLNSYPAIVYGYSHRIEIPDRAYSASGIALLTIDAVIHNFEAQDIADWEKECIRIKNDHHWRAYLKISEWCAIHFAEEYNEVVCDFYEDVMDDVFTDYHDKLVKRFKDRPGFPKIDPPKLPPFPMKAMPFYDDPYREQYGIWTKE